MRCPVCEAAIDGAEPNYMNLPSDYEQGQRDMLAKCIAAVELVPHGGGGSDYLPFRDRVLIAVRALQEKP